MIPCATKAAVWTKHRDNPGTRACYADAVVMYYMMAVSVHIKFAYVLEGMPRLAAENLVPYQNVAVRF